MVIQNNLKARCSARVTTSDGAMKKQTQTTNAFIAFWEFLRLGFLGGYFFVREFFFGFVGSPRDFLGFWFLPPFDHPDTWNIESPLHPPGLWQFSLQRRKTRTRLVSTTHEIITGRHFKSWMFGSWDEHTATVKTLYLTTIELINDTTALVRPIGNLLHSLSLRKGGISYIPWCFAATFCLLSAVERAFEGFEGDFQRPEFQDKADPR